MNVVLQPIIISSILDKNLFALYTNNDGSIPKITIDNPSISLNEILGQFISENIHLEKDSYDGQLLSIENSSDALIINYGCMIPNFSKLKSGKWINIEEVFNEENIQYIQYFSLFSERFV